ncbi:hypothetical protein ALC56_04101 [Trachymyrmex septentrionalis]|uniref:Uncharacterized protein n=1 Tax=Trachymyrmex septentrionalis TaxID=34720 RepID=A0A151JZ86_9HYME|nr:hypothetical protein ALC56_04101 [Trachymyrmex septentrionalis]
MFAFITVNNNNKIVKFNIEDILAIQQLYGIKNLRLTITTQPPPPLSTTTTEITTNKPEYIDLCTLQYVDTVLVLRHRIFVTYSINIDDTKYGEDSDIKTDALVGRLRDLYRKQNKVRFSHALALCRTRPHCPVWSAG